MTGTHPETASDTLSDADGATPEIRFDPRTVTASALALGALVLPDHTRMSPGQRHLLRLARSAYAGWYAADTVRRVPMPEVPAPIFGAVAGAATALVTAPLDEAADGWLADRLRSWGMRRPRLALALVGAGVGAVLALENQNRPVVDAEDTWREPSDLFDTVEVPASARALVEAMLDAVASPGTDAAVPGPEVPTPGPDAAAPAGLAQTAATLRAQLDQAQASVLRDWPMTTDVNFEVAEDTPRVVPHAQGWPVRGHFEGGELPLLVELWIADGRLSHLSIMLRDDDLAEDDARWQTDILDVLETWPTPEEVRLVIETGEGSRPVD